MKVIVQLTHPERDWPRVLLLLGWSMTRNTHSGKQEDFEINRQSHFITASHHPLVQKLGKGDSLLEPEGRVREELVSTACGSDKHSMYRVSGVECTQ